MPKIKTFILWIAGFFVFFTIAGFFAMPPLLKHLLIKNLSAELHRDVSINQIKVNPYTLTIAVRGVAVKEQGTAEIFLSFEELFANIQAVSIFKRAIVVGEIKLTKPYIKVIRDEDGTYNFGDLLEKAATDTAAPAKKSQPLQFSINNITISDGSVDFLDAPKEVFHEVTSLNLSIPFISNIRYYIQTSIQPRFSALVNGDSFAIEGKTKPFAESLETEFDINIHDLDLADYLGYMPARRKFNLLSGALDLTAKLVYIQNADKGPGLEVTGKMTLRDIDLADESSKSLWKVNKTELEIASVKPFDASIHLSRVDIQSPEINMRRNKDGTIDVFTLMGLLAGAKGQQGEAKTPGESKDKKPMSLLVDTWQVRDGKTRFQDFMPQEPVTVELRNAEIEGKNISLAKGSKADVQFSLLMGKSGKVSGKGIIGLDPLSANLSLDVKGININAFQPYFTDKVRVHISSGSVNTSGKFILDQPEGKDVTARYTGKLLVADFAAADKEDFEELLRWQTLSMDNLDVGYNPMRFSVKGMSLSEFFAAITIEPDGTLNLHQLMVVEEGAPKQDEKIPPRTPAAKEAVSPEPTLPANVEIG